MNFMKWLICNNTTLLGASKEHERQISWIEVIRTKGSFEIDM